MKLAWKLVSFGLVVYALMVAAVYSPVTSMIIKPKLQDPGFRMYYPKKKKKKQKAKNLLKTKKARLQTNRSRSYAANEIG